MKVVFFEILNLGLLYMLHLAGIPWLPIETRTILTLHIREVYPAPSCRDILTRLGKAGYPHLAGTLSYVYTETGGISRLAGQYLTLLRMCITQDHRLLRKMDEKEQFVHEHMAREQFGAVLM